MRILNTLREFSAVRRLAQADVVFYLLPFLMLILTIATLAQRDLGLHEAQKHYFATAIAWAGPLPLPGGYLLISLITLSLALKFFFYSDWTWRRAGIHLTHLGVLILLAGGLLTALFAREGYMALTEGQQSPYIYDYRQRQLAVFAAGEMLQQIPMQALKKNHLPSLPFSLHVISACENCAIVKRAEAKQDFGGKPLRGMASFMALETKNAAKNPEENLSGVTFEISGTGAKTDGVYIAFEAMPKPIEITYNKRFFALIFGREQRALPFMVKLRNFTRETYPGTDMARAYSSDIMIVDGGIEWPAHISMNAPLRYRGYTLYQSSFDESNGQQVSILTVVENHGRLLPYIGTGLVAAGILLHLLLVLADPRPS